jgi:hypothetical protein
MRLVVAREGEAGGERNEGARSQRTKAKGKGAAALSDEVRDSPFPLLGFIDQRESCSPNRAPRRLTAGGCICH